MWSIVCKNKLETIATWHFIWQNVVTIYRYIYILKRNRKLGRESEGGCQLQILTGQLFEQLFFCCSEIEICVPKNGG